MSQAIKSVKFKYMLRPDESSSDAFPGSRRGCVDIITLEGDVFVWASYLPDIADPKKPAALRWRTCTHISNAERFEIEPMPATSVPKAAKP